jgi:twinkle protein
MYDEGVPSGLSTGWDCVNANWRVQPGQLAVVTGIPGHGKSEWVDALCVNLALEHGWRTAMYSPENFPVRLHMMKLAEKYMGKPYNPGPYPRMTKEEAVRSKDWINEHFDWVMPEKPSLDEIMAKAQALIFRKGTRVLVLDPWNEVEHSRPNGMTEAEYVSESLMRLRRFARKHNILLIVVAHPRLLEKRSDGTYPVPTPYDISGGAMWRNKADNCIAIYAHPADPTGRVEVHIQKVKFKLFGSVGKVEMTWDKPTGRYFEFLPRAEPVRTYAKATGSF